MSNNFKALPQTEKVEPGFVNWLLIVIAVIADVSAVSALVAKSINQNTLLLGVIILVGILLATLVDRLVRRKLVDPRNITVIILFCMGSIVFALFSWVWLSNTEVEPIQIEITDPTNGMEIEGFRHQVQGTVSDPNARVYVLVHPTAWSDIWVQDPPLVDSAGNWRVNAHIGTAGEGIAQDFEILAIASNENFLVTLATGNWLRVGPTGSDSIPQNTNRSNIVTITRVR
jgi:hypothetical protein